MKTLLAFIVLTSAGLAFAQSESKCFENDSLQGKQIVRFESRGNSISGTFEFENGESELAKAYKFTGTLDNSGVLRVKFENDHLPDVAPSEMKSLVWTLWEKGSGEILRIKFYGKNYETNKFADYFADFEPCEPNYDALLKMARIVQFAKGKNSATAPLSFKNSADRNVFAINARRGQRLQIDAASCNISVYLPGGGLYEFAEWENGAEKTFATTTIDRMTVESLPRTGNYLIVLGKITEDARPSSTTFKITDSK